MPSGAGHRSPKVARKSFPQKSGPAEVNMVDSQSRERRMRMSDALGDASTTSGQLEARSPSE
jgi:hypothetical protein